MSIDLQVFRKIALSKKSYGKFFEIFWGTLNLGWDPEPAKVQGGSLEGVEGYPTVKRSPAYISPNSRYKGSKFDLLGPLAAKP